MHRRIAYLLLGLAATVLVALAWIFIPRWLHPDLDPSSLAAVSDAAERIRLQQAQAALRDGLRSAVLQGAAGVLVIAGAIAALQQVRVGREGHLTEQLSHAIDQLGHDNPDVRIGGLYTLERIARNSPQDRLSIMFLVAAFVRRRVAWIRPAGELPEVDLELPWLRVRQQEVQSAMHVLSRRLVDPMAARLYLARTDLRSVQVNEGTTLINANFNHANLARAWLQGVRLDHCSFKRADLRLANLRLASLTHADFTDADLRQADLRGADLRGANLTRARVDGVLWDRDHPTTPA